MLEGICEMIFGPSYRQVLERAAASALCTPTQCVDDVTDLIPMTMPTQQHDMTFTIILTFVILALTAARPASLRAAKPTVVRSGQSYDDATSS